MKNLSYIIIPEVISRYKNLKESELTKVYVNTIYDYMDRVKKNDLKKYNEEVIKLHDKYWNSRCLYFRVCSLVFKGPKFIFSLFHPVLDWLYSRAIHNMDRFFRILQESSKDSSFYNKICTIESLLWRKRINIAVNSDYSSNPIGCDTI